LIILTFVLGLVYSGDTLEQVRFRVSQLVDPVAATLIAEAVVQAGDALRGGFVYSIVAVVFLLIGASAFSYQLQQALNTIWKIENRADAGLIGMIKKRFSTLVIVFVAGVLLQVSVIISSVLSAYVERVERVVPNATLVWEWVDLGISFVVVTALLALIYEALPDADVDWRDLWIGSLMTAFLFSVGKSVIAFYLSRSSFQSIYGAAGSLMMLLAWFYYGALILLFGAEFTHAFAENHGRKIVASKRANRMVV
jgi:membrane protein